MSSVKFFFDHMPITDPQAEMVLEFPHRMRSSSPARVQTQETPPAAAPTSRAALTQSTAPLHSRTDRVSSSEKADPINIFHLTNEETDT